MASRRPPSRARPTASSGMPPPQTTHIRPRSVLTKSDSSQRSTTQATAGDQVPEAGSSRTAAASQQRLASGEAETNIKVVIRCRRRSEREIQDNSPIIVTTNGARAEGITIETSAPSTSLGVVTLPTTRTYPFDMVFGPEADQATIYHDVVHPMLEEVLMGYNCTLFAYGQTGTGKTCVLRGFDVHDLIFSIQPYNAGRARDYAVGQPFRTGGHDSPCTIQAFPATGGFLHRL